MAVRDDDRLDVLRALAQIAEVGEHEVDPEHVGGREPQARVDDHDPVLVLEDRHVLSDLAQTAERQDAQSAAHAAVASMPWRSSMLAHDRGLPLVELRHRAAEARRRRDRAG